MNLRWQRSRNAASRNRSSAVCATGRIGEDQVAIANRYVLIRRTIFATRKKHEVRSDVRKSSGHSMNISDIAKKNRQPQLPTRLVIGRSRNRTGDTRIFSPVLYQLSYPPAGYSPCFLPAMLCCERRSLMTSSEAYNPLFRGSRGMNR